MGVCDWLLVVGFWDERTGCILYINTIITHTPHSNNIQPTTNVLKFRHQSDEYITTIPEKIDTAARRLRKVNHLGDRNKKITSKFDDRKVADPLKAKTINRFVLKKIKTRCVRILVKFSMMHIYTY